MQDIVNEFQNYIVTVRNYSTHTAAAYVIDIEDFLKFFAKFSGGIPTLGDMTHADTICFRSWLADRQSRGLAFKSTARALSSLRSFYKYLAKYMRKKENEGVSFAL